MVTEPPRLTDLLEAFGMLLLTRVLQQVCFRQVAPWMMRPASDGCRVPPPEVLHFVCCSVASAEKIVPWTGGCLPAAMTGKLMLARHGYESTIHLGVAHRGGSLQAHAWLEAGGAVVTGEVGTDGVVAFRRGAQVRGERAKASASSV